MKVFKKLVIVFLLSFIINIHNVYGQEIVKTIIVESPITPVSSEFIINAIDISEDENVECLVIQLDTPGGLMTSMRSIIKRILASEVPVVVFVSPSGAQSGSAGVFINYSAHISAMAPGTNIGAAHPVNLGGGSDSSAVMQQKILNDATAYIRSLAQKRGRNEEWAEQAVRESVSVTAQEALELNVIDLIANDMDDLLMKIDGMQLETVTGVKTLNTSEAEVQEIEMDFRLKILGLLVDPNIAYIFMMLGMAGVMMELYNPGAIFPGVVGVLSLIIAFYSMQTLPVNYAGLLLIIAAVILFILEIKVVSFGMLTVAGIISLTIGSLMLIDTPYMSISLNTIVPVVILVTVLFVFVIGLGAKAQMATPTTGLEGMIGMVGIVKVEIKGTGKILVNGELWNAVSEKEIEVDAQVKIVSINNMILKVKS